MKMLLVLCSMMALFFTANFAQASTGELIGSAHYLDDSKASQKISPFIGLKVSQELMENLSIVGLGGVGHIAQPEGSELKSQYGRLAADIYYKHGDLKLGFGGGLESDKKVMHQFDDYVHLTAAYPLW